MMTGTTPMTQETSISNLRFSGMSHPGDDTPRRQRWSCCPPWRHSRTAEEAPRACSHHLNARGAEPGMFVSCAWDVLYDEVFIAKTSCECWGFSMAMVDQRVGRSLPKSGLEDGFSPNVFILRVKGWISGGVKPTKPSSGGSYWDGIG